MVLLQVVEPSQKQTNQDQYRQYEKNRLFVQLWPDALRPLNGGKQEKQEGVVQGRQEYQVF